MRESDKPMSFLVRGAMPRRPASDDSGDGADSIAEGKRVEPRGLAPSRLKTPPPRRYRVKPPSRSATPPVIDPANIVEHLGTRFYMVDGDLIPLPVDQDEMPNTREPGPKRPLAKPTPGVFRSSRGRHVPTKEMAGPNRKHPCPVKGCDKVFTKRAHVNRHIASLHSHERSACLSPYLDFHANTDWIYLHRLELLCSVLRQELHSLR